MSRQLQRDFVAVVGGAIVAAAAMLAPALAAAQEVVVRNAWVGAPAPGQKVAGAYMEITSNAAAALVAAESPLAERVELHATTIDAGVMKMRPVERLELPAGKTVKLAPGGLHLMLSDVRQPLNEGARVPITLDVVDSAGRKRQIRVDAEVRGAGGGKRHHSH